MDFLLSINLSFFFAFLPFYITDHNQLINQIADRSFENRFKKQFMVSIQIVKPFYCLLFYFKV